MFQTTWKEFNPLVSYANVLTCEPNYIFGPRFIYDHQFIYIVEGKGRATIQNRHYEALPGTLFYYGPHIVHKFQADAADPFKVYGMHFALKGMLPDEGEITPIVMDVRRDYGPQYINRLFIDGGGTDQLEIPEYSRHETSELQDLFLQITRQYNKADSISHLMNRSYLIQFFSLLQKYVSPMSLNLSDQIKSAMYVKSQLEQNAELPYVRKWLSDWTKYHEDYVSRNFRKQFGLSPHEYHLEQKIKKAKELLAHTDLPINEIAERLHIGTIHYFSRRFKMNTGHSPTGYRYLRRMI